MKEYRVIFCLTNGKRKYATHNGEILLWDDYDLLALRRNLLDYEQFAFTDDFAYFDFRQRHCESVSPKLEFCG